MWQEIEGKRRNSPGRMVFSIFHLEDLKTTFTHLTGEFPFEQYPDHIISYEHFFEAVLGTL